MSTCTGTRNCKCFVRIFGLTFLSVMLLCLSLAFKHTHTQTHTHQKFQPSTSTLPTPICVGLAITVYTYRIWPYIWWFPCQKIPYIHRIYLRMYGSGQPYICACVPLMINSVPLHACTCLLLCNARSYVMHARLVKTMCIREVWQGHHQLCDNIRCVLLYYYIIWYYILCDNNGVYNVIIMWWLCRI